MTKNQVTRPPEKKAHEVFKIDFIKNAGLFGGISLVLVVVSIVFLMIKGITYGIDFRGGTEIQVKFAQPVTIDDLRTKLTGLDVGEVGVQGFGEGSEFIIRFQGRGGASDKETNEMLISDIAKVRGVVENEFKAQGPDIRRVDSVGPQVGAELKKNGLLAVFYCLMVILIYVALRFDYKFAPGAVICLAHDAIITLAIFVAVGKEVNIPILAAILTLIGYSLNDTIVVFDRIRETEGNFKDEGTAYVINKSINDMLTRTLITSGTTFVSSLFLYLFAGGTIEDIAFAMCIGIFFGTYSSIFVAAPLILVTEKMKFLKPTPAKA